ncbi:hypothetical protein PCASD_07306 [Puccinia coronata f. sp. avenae]|uniref:Uncharacterized protein n=1 Tax=Puccinia coronata f. sp. avenae TaxID=200324 RepID=A0A2N5URE8_9BASI|nr:hypothetical protein PCASD_07306 [Puccinia coronata f. sp. avenae]
MVSLSSHEFSAQSICSLIDFGAPNASSAIFNNYLPALSFLMAMKALNEAKKNREVLMKMRRTRLPKEIMRLIAEAMVEGKALELRQEWWNSLKRLLPSSLDNPLNMEEPSGSTQDIWLDMLSKDLLWEVLDSNQCCLIPRKLHHDEEHELHLREYLCTLPRPLQIMNRTPLSKRAMVIDERKRENEEGDGEKEEEDVLVICLPDHIIQYNLQGSFKHKEKEVINQVDLDSCAVDTLQFPRGTVEKVDVETEWSEAFVLSIRQEFHHLLNECDLALGNEKGNGLFDNLDLQLGWWRVEEVVCDCQYDEHSHPSWDYPTGQSGS